MISINQNAPEFEEEAFLNKEIKSQLSKKKTVMAFPKL